MHRKNKNGLEWLEFDLFSEIPNLRHGVFLRHGGVSVGKFSSLNLSHGVGDDPQHVEINRQKVIDLFEIDHLASINQVHGKEIREVSHPKADLPPGDGLTTNKQKMGLLINHADCQAAIFYDPIEKAIANVHCGWRGSVQNIYAAAIEKMKTCYRSKAKNLLVCLSPSLGPDKAEFIHYKKELPEHFWDFQVRPNYFDFWAITEMQLLKEGILPHHIEMARLCTFASEKDCFSYRREKIRGGHGTVAMLL